MKTNKQLFFGLLVMLFIAGCSKDTVDPIQDIKLGATLTANMGSDLSNQVYVDLSEGTLTTVSVNTWELAFENNGNAIRTNSAKKVAVATPAENYNDIISDDGLEYVYDSDDGDLSKTALAGWEINQAYIVDLGVDANGNALGKKKVLITSSSTTSVRIQYADLDGSNETSKTITKGDGNFTFFSLIKNESVTAEPDAWDFVLSAVSVRTGAPCAALGKGAIPGINCDIYRLAASAMTNNYDGIKVAKHDPFKDLEQNDDPASEKNQKEMEDGSYETMQLSDFNDLGASSSADALGRTWLQILAPHSSGVYEVYDFITYIVQDQDNNHYKVRFLAYKGGNNAENGYPTFEYKLITE